MSETESEEEERMERGIVVRERAGRHLVRDTDVVYDVANTVVSKYLARKQSRVSFREVPTGHWGERSIVGAVEGAYLAMTPSMTNQLLASISDPNTGALSSISGLRAADKIGTLFVRLTGR